MNTQTRLTRSATDKVLGGVCGGLAQYFGIDPVIVRLVFVALVLAHGLGLVLYPIMWLVVPAAQTGQPALAETGSALQPISEPRYDPQTGEQLPQLTSNPRNRVLGAVLLGIGAVMLSSFIPGGSNMALALMLLLGGFYLLRRGN